MEPVTLLLYHPRLFTLQSCQPRYTGEEEALQGKTQALSLPDLPLLTQPDSYPQSTDNQAREPAIGGCGQTLEGWHLVPPMSDHIPPQNQGLGFLVPRLKERALRTHVEPSIS